MRRRCPSPTAGTRNSGATKSRSWIPVFVFLFRHRYRDIGGLDRLATFADPDKRVQSCRTNKQDGVRRSNQWASILINSLAKKWKQCVGIGMLKGSTVPKSLCSQAALIPPPPWHCSSDVVGIKFWTDPKATAATLPNGLSPDPKSNGHAIMVFSDWQFTGQDDVYLNPACYQFREAFVLVGAMPRETPAMWCPYIYIDNDTVLTRGCTQGFPKNLGSILQARTYAVARPAAAPVATIGRFGAKPVQSRLSLLADQRSCCGISQGSRPHTRTSRRSTSWRCRSPTILPSRRRGSGGRTEPSGSAREELHVLAPNRIASAFRYSLSY
jgi:Acetoacetate decarboxylase (ADC)